MHRIFIFIYHFISENRWLASVAAILFLVIALFFASKINFDEDINQIIPKNEKADITAKVLSQLNFSDKIIIIIEAKSAEGFALSETADTFINEISSLNSYIKSVEGKVEEDQISETFGFVSENIPLFLNDADYKILDGKLNKDSIAAKLQQNYKSLSSPTSLVTKEFIKKDPLGISVIGLQKLNSLNLGKDFKLEDNYIVTQDGKNLLLFITPKFGGSETKNNEIFIEKLNLIKDKINKNFAGKSEISYFGSPLIAVANAKQIKRDIQRTVFISATVLLVLLIFYFRNFLAPLIIFIPTVFGAAAGLMFMYFIKDKISAISLSVSAILIGITVDYAIHILTHYKHKNNIEEVFKEITHPIVMSASTTAVSFLCLVFVRSEALKDLGIFACVTVLLSAFFTLVIIPHIYKPKPAKENEQPTIIDKMGAYPYEKNRWLVIICSLLIVASFFGFRHIKFNQNINDLNFVPEEIKANERKLDKLSDFTEKSIYVVSYGSTQDEALKKNSEISRFLHDEKIKNNVISFSSSGGIVLSREEQEKKIAKWNSFWTTEKKSETINFVEESGSRLGFNTNAFSDLSFMLEKDFKPIGIDVYKDVKALQLSEFINKGDGIYTVSNVVKIDEEKRDNFIKNAEQHKNVLAIDRQQLNENFLGLLKDDFNTLINYSLVAVILIFILFFRNVDLTIMAVIPIVLSGIVTAGLLYFLGLELNIFSTIVCTLIFGAGVDFNIFLTQALQKELTTGKDQLPIYRVSIILALLTTVLAIGTLVFAKHPALYSVSSVALIGLLSVTFISFAMYPLMFRFIKNRIANGYSPITFRLYFHSLFSTFYYAVGSFLMSFLKFFIPVSGVKGLMRLKKMMAVFLKSILYTNPFVKKTLLNPYKESFNKPAVIIANHASFLDTLAVAMAAHKVIYLVNDRVYNSPLYGRMVRALGFFPVSQGVENNTEKLREKVNQGFSLMIFPEGTRSIDNKVKRFHKGAFYLAEEFELDIVPLYFHGFSEVSPKGDFIIFNGAATVKIGERIDKNDKRFGVTYKERTKKINAFFRKQFAELRKELEDENYFQQTLFLSFLYKDNEVIQSVKDDFRKNKTLYFILNRHIGEDDTILHISDDYGQIDILLALQEGNRKIFSYNPNAEKREIARQNYLLKRRKIIYPENIAEISKPADVLLVSHPDFNINMVENRPSKIIFIHVNPPRSLVTEYNFIKTDEAITILNIKE